MSEHEPSIGKSSDWFTPPGIFTALGLRFDLDPCSPGPGHWVPAKKIYTKADDGLRQPWHGLVFMNPPFGGRRGHVPWLRKFFAHGNGIALCAARTSADWFHQIVVPNAELLCFPNGKTKFHRPDGSIGNEPGTGVVLIGMGEVACRAMRQSKLGACYAPAPSLINDDRQAEEDERTIERIEAQMLERYQESLADYLEGEADMYLRDVLKNIVTDILQRHVAAATSEIARALEDEIEALARDRLADLHTQLESRDAP